MKFALEKLKVSEEWHAPVRRNRAEYKWLQFAVATVPSNAVKLLGRSDSECGFAMEYLDGEDVYVWKTALLCGQCKVSAAEKVGEIIGRIHAASSLPDFDSTDFQNGDDFDALRLDPYLRFTASRHPHITATFDALVDSFYENAVTLVHGDLSPKNIVFRGNQPIVLDAECATMGDPAFDVAFCMNHLILKAVHLPGSRGTLLNLARSFWTSYCSFVDWEPVFELEERVCAWLPALMLARVDGKSPLEYLDRDEARLVREGSIRLICSPSTKVSKLMNRIREIATEANR